MANRGEKLPLPLREFDPPKGQTQRQVKFPKGKKAKRVDADGIQDGNGEKKRWMDPSLAAKERSKRRNKMRESEVLGDQVDGLSGEVQYEDNTNFEDDGIQIEPFNLKQEREEGYFDANGNFVEYAKQNEIKDAWLDSVVVDTKLAGKFKPKASAEEAYDDLSSDDVGKIKRRIANALQPGETIIQALKRLKGPSTDKKAKMLETSKWIFDQLTEDAMKLMENGEYNVYYEDQETFVREAEGYERLAHAKADKSNRTTHAEPTDGEDIFSDDVQHREQVSSIWDIRPGTSVLADSAQQASPGDGGDQFDMFGDDDDTTNVNPPTPSAVSSASDFRQDNQPTSKPLSSSEDLDSGVTTTITALVIIMTQPRECTVLLQQGHASTGSKLWGASGYVENPFLHIGDWHHRRKVRETSTWQVVERMVASLGFSPALETTKRGGAGDPAVTGTGGAAAMQ